VPEELPKVPAEPVQEKPEKIVLENAADELKRLLWEGPSFTAKPKRREEAAEGSAAKGYAAAAGGAKTSVESPGKEGAGIRNARAGRVSVQA